MNEYGRRIYNTEAASWLAQANYIFNHLDITRDFEDFGIFSVSPTSNCSFRSVWVYAIHYCLRLLGPTDNLPPGYLFLCPSAELGVDAPTSLRIPARPAYWSRELSGIDQLSDEEAEDLGFPPVRLQKWVELNSWDASVYDGICQFHAAKGFDPYSQQVATELGYPLLQVSGDRETLVAHCMHSELRKGYSISWLDSSPD
jgi:hypothetical protein